MKRARLLLGNLFPDNMKINLIIDNPSSWFNAYALDLKKLISDLGHRCRILNDQRQIKPATDVTFFLSCEQFILKSTRAKSRFNIVIHAASLPQGRGMSPATWQILEGKKNIPLTLFEAADKIDAGAVYLRDSFKLTGDELIDEWRDKLALAIKKIALKFVKQHERLKQKKQSGPASYYPRRSAADSEIDLAKSLAEQFNLLRVVDNEKYPAWFYFKNHKYLLKIYKE